MSLPLLPLLPGLTWSKARAGKAGDTIVQTALSGKEVRISNQVVPRWNYKFRYSVLRQRNDGMLGQYESPNQAINPDGFYNADTMVDNEYALLQGFIGGRQGAFLEFLFDDRNDDTVGLWRFALGNARTSSYATPYDSAFQGQFPETPLICLDQSRTGLLAANTFGPVPILGYTATLGADGTVAFKESTGTYPQVLQANMPAYITTPAATPVDGGYAGGKYLPGEIFGLGDSETQAFQLYRTMGGVATGVPEQVQNLNGDPIIWINGARQMLGTDFTVGSTGIVVFTSAPATGAYLSWAGKFYQRLRFLKDDTGNFEQFLNQLYAGEVECISILQ